MNWKIAHIALLLVFLARSAHAQLSPGDLANAHKELEGVANCTKCHDIGNRVTNAKCLECHREIKDRTDRNLGYHVSNQVKGKNCTICHNDHHGRNFDMVRFDEKNFDHNATGYTLTGKHAKIDCRQCHQPDNIGDQNLRKRKETFLGLSQQCNTCHDDYHQKTLGNDCAKCHTTELFKPASKFNHDKTDFALAGKHKSVDCAECHQKETRNGLAFQRFADVPAKNCNSCHQDPHHNNLGNNCKECHTEESFEAYAPLKRFNHNKTPFPLKGMHKKTDCRECHQMENATPATVFQDRLGVANTDCKQCHQDVHEGKFGLDCAQCHNEEGFRKVGDLGAFDHDRTSFALEGKHETVDCRKCHTSESMTDPLPHNSCATCHQDYHEGQFAKPPNAAPDCAACHTTDGFAGSKYTLEQHATTRFPLDGAHVATPCFACHFKQEKWQFRGIGERCVDCHQDVHEGQLAAKWYPDKACAQCHQTSGWRDNHFDHSQTAFALQGKHAEQPCRSCHLPDAEHKQGRFAGLSAACEQCHEDGHEGQFVQNGVTDCARCHGFEDWTLKDFNHDRTRFKLEGKHAEVACSACHKEIIRDGQRVVQYKFDSFECVVCHQ